MLRKTSGASLVEYVVLIVLLVALVGGSLLALTDTIYQKLRDAYFDVGS
jgi:Flp pilus assembly pilin Flp